MVYCLDASHFSIKTWHETIYSNSFFLLIKQFNLIYDLQNSYKIQKSVGQQLKCLIFSLVTEVISPHRTHCVGM